MERRIEEKIKYKKLEDQTRRMIDLQEKKILLEHFGCSSKLSSKMKKRAKSGERARESIKCNVELEKASLESRDKKRKRNRRNNSVCQGLLKLAKSCLK